jgi:hypothetical protein
MPVVESAVQKQRVHLVLAAALWIVACKSVPYADPPPIPVPRGLQDNDVEFAILLAIADPPEPPKLSPGQRISDQVLDAIVWSYDSVEEPRTEPWYFEARERRAILVGYQRGPLYMRVRVAYDTETVSLSIVESRNFDQTETKIHRGAFARLQTLENRIRRSLGRVARRTSFGGPV